MEESIGQVVHYFPEVNSCAIELICGNLVIGDRIRIKGNGCDFEQTVFSLMLGSDEIPVANSGQIVDLKVDQPVGPGHKVIKIHG